MSAIVRVHNRTTGEMFVFGAPTFYVGEKAARKQLREGKHPNYRLQSDHNLGHSFDMLSIENCYDDEVDDRVQAHVSALGLTDGWYHGGVELPKSGVVLEQIDPDTGKVLMGWESVAKAAACLGRSESNLEEAVDSGDKKYGFLWKSVG